MSFHLKVPHNCEVPYPSFSWDQILESNWLGFMWEENVSAGLDLRFACLQVFFSVTTIFEPDGNLWPM